MDKWLKKKKLWLTVVLAVQFVALICSLIEMKETVDIEKYVSIVAGVEYLILMIYYIYRLFFLYKDTEKRRRWTMFTVIGVTGTWIVPNQPIICMLLNAIGSILLICCWIHDIVLVYQDKSNQKKETKNKKLDVLEIVLIILVIGIPMVSIAGFISSLMAYIPQLDDTSDHMVEQEPIYEIVFDDIPVHLSDLGVPVEGVESCEMTPGGNGMGLLESYQYETFCLDESEEEVIASCEYTVYTSESSMMINRFASEKIRDPGGKELSQKICDHWKAEKIIQFDNELYIIYEKAILQWNYKDKLTQEQIDTVLSLLHQTYKNIPQ